MKVEIRTTDFDPYEEVHQYQRQALDQAGKYGATALFIGTMRDINQGDDVHAMSLEHYPGMTEKHLQKISREAARRWEILDTLIIHRVGELKPNDPIVVVTVWAAHRAAAFEACRYLMEELKSRAPFWKKETLKDKERWVDKNTH